MKKYRFLLVFILALGSIQGCTKNYSEKDFTRLTIGNRNIGNFIPDKVVAYKPLEGYIIELASDTITIAILLPDLKTGDYSISNQKFSEGKAIFNIGFKKSAYSASEGTISITDTSNNSISGTYSVTNSTNGNGESLKISDGKIDKVPVESFIYGIVEDYEHNQYKTLDIGSQTWMAQNLKSFIYSNGDSIKEVYRYNKSDSLKNIYGLYYTWQAATNNSNTEMTQGACPVGWHLPSNNEWQQLLTELGGETIAGGKLMSMLSWNIPNGWADDGSGFSALGAGIHHPVSEYPDFSERMGIQTYFWSSTFYETAPGLSTAWSVALYSGAFNVLRSPYFRTDMGFSVRCIKN
jgi:uncharacterized protein (TIGR02145 family)